MGTGFTVTESFAECFFASANSIVHEPAAKPAILTVRLGPFPFLGAQLAISLHAFAPLLVDTNVPVYPFSLTRTDNVAPAENAAFFGVNTIAAGAAAPAS